MQSVGASEKLATVIEGESLLNDGVAYVLFEIMLARPGRGGRRAAGLSAWCLLAARGSRWACCCCWLVSTLPWQASPSTAVALSAGAITCRSGKLERI